MVHQNCWLLTERLWRCNGSEHVLRAVHGCLRVLRLRRYGPLVGDVGVVHLTFLRMMHLGDVGRSEMASVLDRLWAVVVEYRRTHELAVLLVIWSLHYGLSCFEVRQRKIDDLTESQPETVHVPVGDERCPM